MDPILGPVWGSEPDVAKFRTGYFDTAVFDLQTVIDQARLDFAQSTLDFDTLVGTGFSGGIVIPTLALALGKRFALVRKEHDDSHHGGGRLIGALGKRWIFVDDFVSSGQTKRRVLDKVADGSSLEDHETSYVGDYLYSHHEERLRPPYDNRDPHVD